MEQESLRLFSSAMPRAKAYRNLQYSIVKDGVSQQFELDCLILYDGNLFLIEAKSGEFPLKARRGYGVAIVENLKRLIAEAHDQAVKAHEYIK